MHLDLNWPDSPPHLTKHLKTKQAVSPTTGKLHHTALLVWQDTENKQLSKKSLGKIMQLRTA